MRKSILNALFILSFASNAFSAEQLEGYFIATDVCEAFQSKNRQTNPGDVFTSPDMAYKLYAINAPSGEYYQIRVKNAPVVESRWVHTSCGIHVVDAGTGTSGLDSESGDVTVDPHATESTNNLLALSWQPAFCEMKPNKAECQELNNGNLPITETQLSLHGLWPQPRGNDYCGVPPSLVNIDKAKRWDELPPVEIDAETAETLSVMMPGTASFLERHEWIKHGTCYHGERGADEYYDDTFLVMDAINHSSIGEFLGDHVGAEVETSDIRALFDDVFGDGAGNKVQFHCAGDQSKTLIQELKINLKGKIEPDASIATLFLDADDISIGCPRGVIDPTGLQ